MKRAALLVGLGFEAALLLWLAVWVGERLSSRFGSMLTLILIVLVLLLWFYQMLRLLDFRKKRKPLGE